MKRIFSQTRVGLSQLVLFSFILAIMAPLTCSVAPTALAASREPVRAKHGIVASTSEIASQVGVEILKHGGNAVDAAISVAFAEAVTHPSAGNIGGGGFLMFRLKGGQNPRPCLLAKGPSPRPRKGYLPRNRNSI